MGVAIKRIDGRPAIRPTIPTHQADKITSMIPRSEELWTVAYFLSRSGYRPNPEQPPKPPSQLGVGTWHESYDRFFSALGAGRTVAAFRHTLKNARDNFDSHFDSGRVGWRDSSVDRPPQPLGVVPNKVFSQWNQRSDGELWEHVAGYLSSFATPQATDMPHEPPGRSAAIIYRILRDTELARRIKEMHQYRCQICGHFILLPEGFRYAEAHHIQPLGHPHNGPDSIGNILCLCPNHHAELDYGVVSISLSSLRQFEDHPVDSKFVDYHNCKIHRPGIGTIQMD